MTRVLLAAGGYLLLVFPLAYVWHLQLFGDLYHRLGYFDGTPNVALGFATIVLQGGALALLFPRFRGNRSGLLPALQFVALAGLFFWTSHVLALVAKQSPDQAALYVLLESGYLMLQFGLYGLVLAWIYRGAMASSPASA